MDLLLIRTIVDSTPDPTINVTRKMRNATSFEKTNRLIEPVPPLELEGKSADSGLRFTFILQSHLNASLILQYQV